MCFHSNPNTNKTVSSTKHLCQNHPSCIPAMACDLILQNKFQSHVLRSRASMPSLGVLAIKCRADFNCQVHICSMQSWGWQIAFLGPRAWAPWRPEGGDSAPSVTHARGGRSGVSSLRSRDQTPRAAKLLTTPWLVHRFALWGWQ